MSIGKTTITMKDVAELAGVSISSVSHVINKTRRVEDETKRTILDAIERLDYTPNLFARSLKGKGTKLLGVIISDIRDTFFAEIVKSIEFNAQECCYNVILCDSENNPEKEQMYLNTFISMGIDGIIFSPADTTRAHANLISSRIPFVQIDRKLDPYNADFVGIDNVHTSRLATEFLIKENCRHIGYIGFNNNVYTQQARQQGLEEVLQEHQIHNKNFLLQLSYHNMRRNGNLRDYFNMNPQVDGLLCCNNNCCYEVLLEIERMGKQIPADIKIVTYDDAKWFDFLKYPISVIVQPTEAIGRLAVDCVVERIEKKNISVRKDIVLETEFISRTG